MIVTCSFTREKEANIIALSIKRPFFFSHFVFGSRVTEKREMKLSSNSTQSRMPQSSLCMKLNCTHLFLCITSSKTCIYKQQQHITIVEGAKILKFIMNREPSERDFVRARFIIYIFPPLNKFFYAAAVVFLLYIYMISFPYIHILNGLSE